MPTIVTLDQQTDTPARREIMPAGVLTYLYDRSLDSKKSRAPGQDFIAYCYDERRLTFAVCDGVSQSFYGELAARFLGERLVAWLSDWQLIDEGDQDFAARIEEVLCGWTDEATRLVQARPVNTTLPPMVQKALAKKRENGSEAMFVAGQVDFAQEMFAACWMGDLRLCLWDRDGDPINVPGAVLQTRERWSTRVGPKNGKPHATISHLRPIGRITVHSDGIGSRAPELYHTLSSLDDLDQLARDLEITPGSDDISILDIVWTRVLAAPLAAPEPYQPDADEPVIRWAAIGGADWYRVEIVDENRQWTADTNEVTFFVPGRSMDNLTCRVQALSSDRAPSRWSSPVTLQTAILAEIEPAVTAPEPYLEKASEEAVIVTGYRPFRTGIVLLISVLLALVLTVGWICCMPGERRSGSKGGIPVDTDFIIRYIRNRECILIDQNTAERIKTEYEAALPNLNATVLLIDGVDVVTGEPLGLGMVTSILHEAFMRFQTEGWSAVEIPETPERLKALKDARYIVRYLHDQHHLLIGHKSGERIQKEFFGSEALEHVKTYPARGQDLLTGLPATIELTSVEVMEALAHYHDQEKDSN